MLLQENVQPFHILPGQGHITESGEGEESKRLRLRSYESEPLDVQLHITEYAAMNCFSTCNLDTALREFPLAL